MEANKPKKPAASQARRQFLLDSARMACGVGLLGIGIGLYAKQAKALPPLALRPPGALVEKDFLGACVRCGLCVRDCPYDILSLAKPEEPVATGTPYFVARQLPCEMCEDIPCVKACPTGALDHSLTDITKARMGLAVLIDHETCLNWLGMRCDVCYRVCPLIDKAIEIAGASGIAVVGGFVYRGSRIPGLAGMYVFGDFSSGRIFRLANGAPPLEVLLDSNLLIPSFAQDASGELYALNYGEGAVYRIVEAGIQ